MWDPTFQISDRRVRRHALVDLMDHLYETIVTSTTNGTIYKKQYCQSKNIPTLSNTAYTKCYQTRHGILFCCYSVQLTFYWFADNVYISVCYSYCKLRTISGCTNEKNIKCRINKYAYDNIKLHLFSSRHYNKSYDNQLSNHSCQSDFTYGHHI